MTTEQIKTHLRIETRALAYAAEMEEWADVAASAQAIEHFANVLRYEQQLDEAGIVKE